MPHRSSRYLPALLTLVLPAILHAQEGITKPDPATSRFSIGAIVRGGKGLTENRDDYKFTMAGIHLGKALFGEHGRGPLRGSFELGNEIFPLWQSYTPRFQRTSCFTTPRPGATPTPGNPGLFCTPSFTVGGTFSGINSGTTFRWNLHGSRRITPYLQADGGLLWTNHKYPAYGSTGFNLITAGPASNTSVWNFEPGGGIGFHYFVSPRRSVDLGANAVHISSASLGDRNPGVNASVQFDIGYTWWK